MNGGDFVRTHFACPDAKFTPGPYDMHGPALPTKDAPEGGDFAICAGGQIIAEVFRRSDEAHTHPAHFNARLFATAPMLFAVALEMEGFTWARMLDAAEEGDKADHDLWNRLHELCVAAIESVTGVEFINSTFVPKEAA